MHLTPTGRWAAQALDRVSEPRPTAPGYVNPLSQASVFSLCFGEASHLHLGAVVRLTSHEASLSGIRMMVKASWLWGHRLMSAPGDDYPFNQALLLWPGLLPPPASSGYFWRKQTVLTSHLGRGTQGGDPGRRNGGRGGAARGLGQ